MAITFPFDLLDGFPGWSAVFEILRREELSRTAGGVAYGKDFGDPLWRATYVSRVLSANELDFWRARFDALDGGQQQFRGYPLSRCAPIAYPKNAWPTTNGFNGDNAALSSIAANRKVIRLTGLGGGYILSAGDMLRIGERNLHRVVTGGIASSGGVIDNVEIRPHLWPETQTGNAVSVRKPFCIMTVLRDSLQTDADPSTGRGSIRFDAMESR